jgi:hypothetical protein
MKSLVHIDLSENTFDTDNMGRVQSQIPWLSVGSNATLSSLWYHLSRLKHIKTFHMKDTTLKDKHFTIYDAMYIDQNIVQRNKLAPGVDFNVMGSPVTSINWRMSLAPKLQTCMTKCEQTEGSQSCCVLYSFPLRYDCGPTNSIAPNDFMSCKRNEHAIRPPLWLAIQLAPTLHSIDLSMQEYYSDGNELLQTLCNGVISNMFLNRAFINKTTLPPCIWEQSTLVIVVIQRKLRHTVLPVFDDARNMDTGLQFLINGTLPKDLRHLTHLGRFECCDDFNSQKSSASFASTHWKYLHPLHGPLPLFSSSLQAVKLELVSVSGAIPLQWCNLQKLYRIVLHGLPYVHSTLPACWGNLSTLTSIHLNSMPGLTGVVPWGSTHDEFNNVTIIRTSDVNQETDFKNTKWIHLLENSLFRLQLSIIDTNLTGHALPNRFPSSCYFDYIYINGNSGLGGTLSPTIANCHINDMRIKNVHFQGDFPGHEICSMCDLKYLLIDNTHNFSHSSVTWFKDNCNVTQHRDLCAAKNQSSLRSEENGYWSVCYSGPGPCY